ncbi:MAG: NUDIX hydrolase [Clostridiales bacterium]|nr:NUDIX hydrolase [Clostridiales bacterium]
MNAHEIIDTTTVLRGKIFDVAKRTVRLPNGETAVRDAILHNGASAIIPILDDGRVLLERQYRDSVGAEILEIPAGRLEPGEDPAVCAARELAEETGYRAARLKLVTVFYPAVGYSNEKIHLFLANGLTAGETRPDEDEFVEPEAYTLEEAFQMIDDGEIIDGKTVMALLLYARARAVL